MIPNDALTNAVRSLGYKFKRQADRVNIFKKTGGTERVAIRRNVMHDEDYAVQVLRQAGMAPGDIERFIQSVKTSKH